MLLIKGGESLPKAEVIKTPSLYWNHLLGGGLWSGRIHTIWGSPQAGKSTIALQTMAAAQEQGWGIYQRSKQAALYRSQCCCCSCR